MRMISIVGKISKSGATAARAQLTFYAHARLNRYPRITDAGGLPRISDVGIAIESRGCEEGG